MRLALSILAHSSYDSRQARQALLQCPGLLPYLVRGVCRAKGVDTGKTIDTRRTTAIRQT
jgi:hypothetical protein